jgi:hypothetical protein
MSRAALIALLGIVATPALAVGDRVDVSIIDRDTGQTLKAYHHKGEYWVAGRPGAHYSINIQSRTARRVLAVTSVDGVNILTGETAGHGQRGYVFDPWQGYPVAGWRKSDSEIAAFTFTSIPKSYASRTGRPENVGVIGVAVFTEKRQPPPPPPPKTNYVAPEADTASAESRHELEEVVVTGSRVQRGDAAGAEAPANIARGAPAAPPSPSLGTGHGRRELSLVTQVPFERARSEPDEIVRIRYDSHDNLVAMGIIRQSPPRPRPLDPFPESSRLGYVPDP